MGCRGARLCILRILHDDERGEVVDYAASRCFDEDTGFRGKE
jgi:hypothetical protein